MAIFSVGGNFGFAAGPILATLFLKQAGQSGTLGFLFLNGIMGLLLWFYLSNITQIEVPHSPSKTKKDISNKQDTISRWEIIFPVIVLLLIIIMRTGTHYGIVTFLPQYYMHHLHYGQTYAAVATSLFLFSGAFGTLAGGPIADRWGLKTVIIISMALMIPLLYLFPRCTGTLALLVMALSGFTLISTFAITVVLGQELLPKNVGLASGLTLGFGVGTGGVGATFLGWVADHWGLPSIFHVMIIFTSIALVLTFFLPNKEKLQLRKNYF